MEVNEVDQETTDFDLEVSSWGVTRYEIVVGHTLNPFSKSGGALCYQTTKKWWGTCPQATPMVTPLQCIQLMLCVSKVRYIGFLNM